ncbi:MAG TPA: class I SAM-dependent methyltransferase [Acidimicrobiales bacterium]|nr:class I SAM-dependent methyltransferase [Acidimicrobiales bacterium]
MARADERHNDLIRREFTRQLPIFADKDSYFARANDATLAWLQPLSSDMVALDVACGAAHATEVCAPHVRQVVGVDLTRALLQAGAQRLQERGMHNVLLQVGDAADLPFLDESFDLVFCRFAVHHFADPPRQIAEMARVCRRGGRVVISDMVAPAAEQRVGFDDLHRLLDPSHARALPSDELTQLTETLVGPIIRSDISTATTPLALERMINPSSDRVAVLAALRRELDGGPATGFMPSLGADGALQAAFSSMVVHATRS